MSLIIFSLNVSQDGTSGLGQKPSNVGGGQEHERGWASCFISLYGSPAVTKAERMRAESSCVSICHQWALWSSAELSIKTQVSNVGVFGELRPPSAPEGQPHTQHDSGCRGILGGKSRFGTEFCQFLLERAKLRHFEEFYRLLQHVHKIMLTFY